MSGLLAGKRLLVTGVITDAANGETLIGVNVLVKGTYYGAASDVNGRFTIREVNPGQYTLELSFIGYKKIQKTGVNVAAGDIDGDGFAEIVTGAGPGAVFGPHVRGWNVDGGAAASIPGLSFFAYGTIKYGDVQKQYRKIFVTGDDGEALDPAELHAGRDSDRPVQEGQPLRITMDDITEANQLSLGCPICASPVERCPMSTQPSNQRAALA